jgi:ADP-dependent NAD(P)H-hydrate dehydratase / NAD(P)H-hydrate epimerase
MQPVLTSSQMAALDRYTIETVGLDGKLLMSNAAREVLRVLLERFPRSKRPVIFAGTGNNGGDGIALAYYALQAGLAPALVICHPGVAYPPQLSEDAQYFFRICEQAYVPTKMLCNPAPVMEVLSDTGADLVVDALFGTGLDRRLGEYYLALIDRLNHAGLPVLAVDCPSGLNCTTGEVMGDVLRADATVTMGHAKRGFYHPAAGDYLGALTIARLGFASLTDAGIAIDAHAWPDACWEPLRKPRAMNTHKGHYGRLLIIAGSRRYTGAPRLAARAAMRAGAGLVRLVVPGPIHAICCDDPAVMVSAHACDGHGGFAAEPSEELLEDMAWADALVIGPGMSASPDATQLVQAVLAHAEVPVVIDADGLRALWQAVQDGPGAELGAGRRDWPLLLTPHTGELGQLAGVSPAEANARWFELPAKVADKLDAIVLAKSCQCQIALPGGGTLFPRHGNPALASGGTGDVLAGMLGALLARYHAGVNAGGSVLAPNAAMRRLQIAEITATAVNLHAMAAQLGVEDLGENGLTATDLVDYIPDAMLALAQLNQH